MIISRVNLFTCTAVWMACVMLAPVSSAQTPLETQTLGKPFQLTPRALSPVSPEQEDPNNRTISGGINVQSLEQVSTEAVGTLNAEDGFSAQMWQGSNRLFVENLLSDLPNKLALPALKQLQEKLLLSAASPPKGPKGPQDLINLRAAKLYQMGKYDHIIQLIDNIAQAEQTPSLALIKAQALFLKGEFSKVCALTATQIQSGDTPFWLKALALCRMLAGQGDQAMLSLSLLRENGEIDPLYDDLMNGLHNAETPKIETLPSANALGLSLIKTSKARLSDDILQNATQSLNLIVKDADQFSPEQKANALVGLTHIGFDTSEDLKSLLSGFEFSEEQKGNALDLSTTLPALEAQALLYQVGAQSGQISVIKTEIIALALEQARKNNSFKAFAQLYGPLISSIAPTPDLIWFAPIALETVLNTQNIEAARPWFLLLQNAALRDAEADKLWTDYQPLAIFTGFQASRVEINQSLEKWWMSQPKGPEKDKKAAVLFSLIEGLGIEVSERLWLSLHQSGDVLNWHSPKSGFWIKMNRAALSSKTAETVSLLLLAYGEKPVTDMNPVFLRDSLFSLRTVGLNQDARRLALDLALAAHF